MVLQACNFDGLFLCSHCEKLRTFLVLAVMAHLAREREDGLMDSPSPCGNLSRKCGLCQHIVVAKGVPSCSQLDNKLVT